nr:LysR family transcriptional regulator [Novosphingobium profundi]
MVQLKRMIAIYESGSLRKASKAIGITQPALTLSIKQLEEEFNTSLFERGPSGVRPTAMCERLVRRARLMLAEERRIVHELTEADRRPRVAIGVHPGLHSPALANTLRSFVEQSPPIDLKLRDGYTTQLITMLASGEIDFALVGVPIDFADDAYDFEPLLQRDYAIVARPDHPLVTGDPDADPAQFMWAQLSAYDSLDPFETDDFAAMVRSFGCGEDSKVVRISSAALHKSMIVDAGMIGMIGSEAVADELAAGTLVRIEGSQIASPVFGFATLKDKYETRLVRQLKAAIRRSCEN